MRARRIAVPPPQEPTPPPTTTAIEPSKWTLSMQGDRAILTVPRDMTSGVAVARLTAREAVRLAQTLLACADALFREEDVRRPTNAAPTR